MTVAEFKGSAAAKAPTEDQECMWLCEWAQMTRWRDLHISDVLILVPNGAYHGADREAAAVVAMKLRQKGLQPGVFDYILPVPIPRLDCPGLWLEMKRTKGGVVSDDQKKFQERMLWLGWRCNIARGWVEASEAIDRYLKLAKGDVRWMSK